jgi:hypothetical protein
LCRPCHLGSTAWKVICKPTQLIKVVQSSGDVDTGEGLKWLGPTRARRSFGFGGKEKMLSRVDLKANDLQIG